MPHLPQQSANPRRAPRERVLAALAATPTVVLLLSPLPAHAQTPLPPSSVPAPASHHIDSLARSLRSGPPLPTDGPRVVELPPRGARVPLAAPGVRPIVEAFVDERGPYRFAIETGADFTTISPRVAAAAGLTAADTANPVVTVGALALGLARLRDLRVRVLPDPIPGVDGILGLNAYRDLLLTLDYPRREVRLARGALPRANGRDRLALLPADGLWEVAIDVGGRRERAVLDTQNGTAFAVTPTAARKARFTAAPVVTGFAQGPGIGTQPLYSARLAGDLRVGDVTFRRPLVSVIPLPLGYPEHWNLGAPALAAFTVTLDQRGRVLQLTRTGSAVVPAPAALRTSGFRAPMRGGRRVVTDVTPGGAAARGGVRTGEEVVRVDHRPVADLAPDEWSAILRRPGPVPIRLRASDGGERDVVLHPAVVVP